MDTIRLSSKGQIIIPKPLRDAYQWEPGQEFSVIDLGDGILLRAKRPFPATELKEVAGSLSYAGPPISVSEMDQAIARGIKARLEAERSDDHS